MVGGLACFRSEDKIHEYDIHGNVLNTFVKGRQLGKGGFATCFEVTHLQSGRIFAGKIISKQNLKERTKMKIVSEIKILNELNHDNIVKMEYFFEDSENVYIMLTLCLNQTISELVKRRKIITETEAQYFLYQIATGVHYIHSKNIVHRE
jgi:polo-like kinase 1